MVEILVMKAVFLASLISFSIKHALAAPLEACSTPSGTGTCVDVSACSAQGGTSYAGYCSGPNDIQCCIKGGGNDGTTCTCNSNGMCTNIPADNNYYLTSFCDSSVACGSFSGDCNEYYSADYSRFGCNSIISCCQGLDCVNLKVIDGGPGCSVENSAGKPVIDASYSTCKHFTGSTSCGWSDHIPVTCKKTSYTILDTAEGQNSAVGVFNGTTAGQSEPQFIVPLGPCSYDAEFAARHAVPRCGHDKNLF